MNPILYFGEQFVMELFANQQVNRQDIINIDDLIPVPLSVFRQHIGFSCIKHDVYFEYEDSNDLIEGIQNAEFDAYRETVTKHMLSQSLNAYQMTHIQNNQLRNASIIRVW